MTLTITATFAHSISEKEAVSRLALALTEGITWREDPINRADRIVDLPKISQEINLRALHARIVF